METIYYHQLLVFVWQYRLYDSKIFHTNLGDNVTVIDCGSRNYGDGPEFKDATIMIGNTSYVGDVSINVNSTDWAFKRRNLNPQFDGVILNVVGNDDGMVRKIDDSTLPSLEISYPERLLNRYKMLIKTAGDSSCVNFLDKDFKSFKMRSALERLMVERLERKCADVMEIYNRVGNSWHETFYVMMFTSMGMGDKGKKELYKSLAFYLPYSKLCQERGDIEDVEAMIFGVGGHLDSRTFNDYKERLWDKFQNLSKKHDLTVLEYCKWTERGVRPHNFSTIRLAQLASLINENSLTLDNLLSAEKMLDVRRLFDITLPVFWKRSISFQSRSILTKGKLSDDTIDLMIINFVAPLMFAYGYMNDNQVLKDRAMDFLDSLAPEINRYTNMWTAQGIELRSACHSQAIIQLANEYCAEKRCTDCFVGIKALKSALK